MKLFAGGTRGTRATVDQAYAVYGGDTTCFLVTGAGNEQAIVDAGTGLRSVTGRLSEDRAAPVRFFFTHYHLDHMIGLLSFAPLYQKERRIEIFGPEFDGKGPAAAVGGLFAPPYWPVPLADLSAQLDVAVLPDSTDEMVLGGLRVRWLAVRHPGGCRAYRFDEPATGHSLVIATDMEWAESDTDEQAAFLHFCRTPQPANLLLMDGQFSAANYPAHRGWGHSRWEDVLAVANQAGIGTPVVIHHDPNIGDAVLATREREFQAACPEALLLPQDRELAADRD